VPGKYSLVVSVMLGKETADKFTSPIELLVVEGDFFQSNRMTNRSLGDVLVHHEWQQIGG
jgi:hypothetical protein